MSKQKQYPAQIVTVIIVLYSCANSVGLLIISANAWHDDCKLDLLSQLIDRASIFSVDSADEKHNHRFLLSITINRELL